MTYTEEQVDSMHAAISILEASDKPAHVAEETFLREKIRDAKNELKNNI